MSLGRTIGIPGALVLGLGSMVGTGVFVAMGLAASVIGDRLPLAIGLAAIVAMLNGLSAARLAARHPVAGGTAVYARKELHPMLGTAAGWLFLVAKGASAATAAIGLTGYLFPNAPGVIALIPVAIATGIALVGLRFSMISTAVLVVIAVGALLTFSGWAFTLPRFGAVAAESSASIITYPLLHATALMFVAFTGYGRIATLGEEIRDPSRSIPRAVIITIMVTAGLYAIVALATLHAMGAKAFAATAGGDAPLATLARESGGETIARLILCGAVAAVGGVLLNLVLGLSRVVLALGREGDLPSRFAVVRNGRPNAAILLVGLGVGIVAIMGSIQTAWTTSAAAVLIYYALTNLAAIAAARREADRILIVTATAGLLGCGILALALPAQAWLPTGLAVVGGLIISGFVRPTADRLG